MILRHLLICSSRYRNYVHQINRRRGPYEDRSVRKKDVEEYDEDEDEGYGMKQFMHGKKRSALRNNKFVSSPSAQLHPTPNWMVEYTPT